MRHPLNFENRDDFDDIKHYYNPNLYSGQNAYSQISSEEYPQPDIRGPQPKNAHPDSTFSSHLHNDWTHVQLDSQVDSSFYPTPEQRGDDTPSKSAYWGEPIEDRRFFSFEEEGDY